MEKHHCHKNRNVENMGRCRQAANCTKFNFSSDSIIWARYQPTKFKHSWRFTLNDMVMEDIDGWYKSANKTILSYNSAQRIVVIYITDVSHENTCQTTTLT